MKGEAAAGARLATPEFAGSEGPKNVPRRLAAEVVDASLRAQKLVSSAQAEADSILARAREAAAGISASAADQAREREVARLAGMFLALKVQDERRAERDLDRVVALARVLAERLLGEVLESDPTRILALARQALLEARGARRAIILACPLDAETLKRHVVDIGLAAGEVEIQSDPSLSRGSLRVHTNLGSLDAQLTPQLERLAEALRDALA